MQLEPTVSRNVTFEPGIVILLIDDDVDEFILLRDCLAEVAPDIGVE